jgi:hypothetical protein
MWWFTPVALVLAVAGLVVEWRSWRAGGRLPIWDCRRFKASGWEERVIWLIFILLVGFQFYMAFSRTSFDGDDAYYVVQSLTAQQRDVLYRIEPYTGLSSLPDMRHALAAFPLWIAMVAVKSDIHATIVSHSIMPLVLLFLSYLLFFQIGRLLLDRDKGAQVDKQKGDRLPVFMVIMAVVQMFGNVSIYTTETFLMTRTWQGKSFAANVVIPSILWLFLALSSRMGREYAKGARKAAGEPTNDERASDKSASDGTAILWIMLGGVNWMAGLGSSLAVFLCVIITGIYGLLMSIGQRRPGILIRAGLACVPGGIYTLLYLLSLK